MAATKVSETSAQLTSCKAILLVLVGEPVNPAQKDSVISELEKGIKSWNVEMSGCNIFDELETAQTTFTINDEGSHGEKVLTYNSDVVSIEVLIYPTFKLAQSKLKQFFTKEGSYRHLVYAGPSVRGASKWILQDALFSWNNFLEIFQSSEVLNAIKQNVVRGHVIINSYVDNNLLDVKFSKATGLSFKLNAPHQEREENVDNFIAYISQFVVVEEANILLRSTDVVGNIRFNRPTIYIFPACQGDSALFGINGFNLLVDGGYSKKSCFWDFARHLDRLDAILISHLSIDNYFGINSLLIKKFKDGFQQEIGCVFVNSIKDTAKLCDNASNNCIDVDSLSKASVLIESMKLMNIIFKPCFNNSNMQPINLYHKVGHGSLDLFVLSPSQNSKSTNEFLSMWSKNVDPFVSKVGQAISDCVSICAILVWKPASPHDTITRLLLPGAVNQSVLFEGMEKLKNISLFHQPTCREKDLNPHKPEKKPAKLVTKTDVTSPRSDHSGKSKNTWPAKKESVGNDLNKSNKKEDAGTNLKKDKIKPELIDDNKETNSKLVDENKELPTVDASVEVLNAPMPEKDENLIIEPTVLNFNAIKADSSEPAKSLGDVVTSVEQVQTDSRNVELSRQDSLENIEEAVLEPGDDKLDGIDLSDPNSLNMGKLQEGLSDTVNQFDSISDKVEVKCQGDEIKGLQDQSSNNGEKDEKDVFGELNTWDKPLGVPPPYKMSHKITAPSSSKKLTARGTLQTGRTGPSKFGQKLGNVIYLDLAYIPQHGDPHHVDVDFFKRVRARYYVLSTICPDAVVLTALLEGKQTWEDPSLEVTIIPTYDTEVLRYWMAAHQGQLSQLRINVAPAANRCTIQLQDHETSCAAYRLEF
ncbi:hypothetical protein HELRODRAFT_188466 [Helobdella robusta]|uniref:Uncharacterized protein n=1 Tax=Helobdella robusta TaxID=6412 RepID=T1FQ07_HELRO|nr:hypothetical protein HELRODRAFT_188466 [Helobdella robusta]ESO06713.1 hypothetical protein HELRODRAFT_188466 [Helobdella robusta]